MRGTTPPRQNAIPPRAGVLHRTCVAVPERARMLHRARLPIHIPPNTFHLLPRRIPLPDRDQKNLAQRPRAFAALALHGVFDLPHAGGDRLIDEALLSGDAEQRKRRLARQAAAYEVSRTGGAARVGRLPRECQRAGRRGQRDGELFGLVGRRHRRRVGGWRDLRDVVNRVGAVVQFGMRPDRPHRVTGPGLQSGQRLLHALRRDGGGLLCLGLCDHQLVRFVGEVAEFFRLCGAHADGGSILFEYGRMSLTPCDQGTPRTDGKRSHDKPSGDGGARFARGSEHSIRFAPRLPRDDARPINDAAHSLHGFARSICCRTKATRCNARRLPLCETWIRGIATLTCNHTSQPRNDASSKQRRASQPRCRVYRIRHRTTCDKSAHCARKCVNNVGKHAASAR